jgi:hypothetical protein
MSCRSVLDLGGDSSFSSTAEVNKDKKRGGRRGREGFYSGADSDIDKMTGKAMTDRESESESESEEKKDVKRRRNLNLVYE